MELDDSTFRRLLDLEDPVGVLTVTTGFVPGTTDDQATRIDLRNRLRARIADLERQGNGERCRALEKVVGALGDDLDGVLDPRQFGRGRALFVTLSDGQRYHINVQVPFDDRVEVGDRAFVRPLVAAIDEGRPAGVVVGTRSGARVLEWSLVGTRAMAELEFELTDAQLADGHRGPSNANPGRGQQAANHKEAFEDRVDGNRQRFLKEVADSVAGLAEDRRWDRVVVAGSDRIQQDLVGRLRGRSVEVIAAGDAAWEDLSPGRIGQEAWPLLRSVHREREQALVADMVETAHAGGPAALGARRVCEAANVGRVSHLLFTSNTDVAGYLAEDGTLHDEVAGVAAQAGLTMQDEPNLVERLVEKVLATGGRVTRIDGDQSATALTVHQGLGARLRW